jgi:CheY-like chemotaxis protein
MQAFSSEWALEQRPLPEDFEASPVHILLAEDDGDLRQLLATALRVDGYVVTEAEDGEALADRLIPYRTDRREQTGAFDLIVSDIKMPGPSGLWALSALRKRDWATPFLIITALSEPDLRQRARQLGAAAVLSKPINLARFRGAVMTLAGPAESIPDSLFDSQTDSGL